MIRIILLGPPGSGKGTQAHLIANHYNISHISTGEILRKTSLYKRFRNVIKDGKLVNDDLMIQLITKRINKNDCNNGFVLDGFPRTINQAISLKKRNIFINFVIELDVLDSIIIDRINGRQIHMNSGRTYHIKYNPPKTDGLDDITGEKLIIRQDDNVKTMIQRLNQYRQNTTCVSKFYQKESKNACTLYFMVNGNQQIIKIYEKLINIITLNIS